MKKNIAVTTVLVILVTIIVIRLTPYSSDDSYIHFRISENFERYFLPYFNVTERVMSTSSFVWTCILAILIKLPIAIPFTVAILNSISVILGAFIWSHLFRDISKQIVPALFVYIFQIIYIGMMLPSAAELMETPFALLLLGISIYLLINDQPFGWVLISFTMFLRYEICIFAGLFLIIWLINRPFQKKVSGIIFFVLTTTLLSFILFYFYSTVIPNTTTAKQIVYQLSISNVFDGIFFSLFPRPTYPFLGLYLAEGLQNKIFELTSAYWMPFIILLIGAICINVLLEWKKADFRIQKLWGIVIFLGGVIIATAYIIKHVFLFGWYIPLYAVPIVWGIYLLALHRGILSRLMAIVISLIPVSTLFLYVYSALVTPSVLPQVCPKARVQRYIQVGGYLNTLFPNAKLLSSEIGGLGYGFHGEIIDAVGLVTPGALKYHPMRVPQERSSGAIGAIPPKLVNDISPEIIVTYPIFVERFEVTRYANKYIKLSVPAFSKDYRESLNCQSLWGYDKLYIYIRKDIATDEALSFLISKLDN